ncbi:MAG: hypothetical protein ABEH47_05970 [Haloferacaceae archaeon]
MIDSGETRGCPLCDREITDAADLRVHLMTTHRKSELTDEFLALVREREPAVL